MEFIKIPSGEFNMGSPDTESDRDNNEGPVHRVTIGETFYLGKYPVTQKQWKAVMGNNPSNFKGDDRPVEKVSWDAVQDFINILNEKEGTYEYCLPSEAEWEYACRAGTTTRYSFGDAQSKLREYAWYDKNSGSETHPVGKKKPNPWGLYDMHGNVWEWVQDEWHADYDDAPDDGSSWEDDKSSYRVARGGGWFNVSSSCRSANRGNCDPGFGDSGLGFRLLRKI
ncbi:MAG: formylglycine-generating enzyme family protein [Methanosarcinaceae archaeon]|nr:formylglycine-generating enzyme family protein [Methanosarcinaceae archaeon]